MEQGILHLHNLLRWVILILLLIAIMRSISPRNPFTNGHRKLGLALMISADVMLLVGLYQWFTSPLGLKSIQANGMDGVMKDGNLRFFAIEHMIGMIIAIILIHIGYSYAKRSIPDNVKHKRTLLFYVLALLVILAFVPWPFREFGRPLFPGMD
jgi:hypothetical protein